MNTRRRLSPEGRRQELLDVGAELFAELPYDDVTMEQMARRAGVSRALLYRHFPGKRELFAAIYRRAATDLLAVTTLDTSAPMERQVSAGLDAHIDYFAANRLTVLAANRALAADPMIQAIISEELAELRRRMLDAFGLTGRRREVASSTLHAWLLFVQAMSVDWLEQQTMTRTELRDICLGALYGSFGAAAGSGTSPGSSAQRGRPAESGGSKQRARRAKSGGEKPSGAR